MGYVFWLIGVVTLSTIVLRTTETWGSKPSFWFVSLGLLGTRVCVQLASEMTQKSITEVELATLITTEILCGFPVVLTMWAKRRPTT